MKELSSSLQEWWMLLKYGIRKFTYNFFLPRHFWYRHGTQICWWTVYNEGLICFAGTKITLCDTWFYETSVLFYWILIRKLHFMTSFVIIVCDNLPAHSICNLIYTFYTKNKVKNRKSSAGLCIISRIDVVRPLHFYRV